MVQTNETDEIKISRICNYLVRAHKHGKPSILLALYLSEFIRINIEKSIIEFLNGQGLKTIDVDSQKHKDIPAFCTSAGTDDTVFLIHNMTSGFPQSLRYLNYKREDLIDNRIKALFWVTEKELCDISLEAQDFFAFRNRVVDFMQEPLTDERKPLATGIDSYIKYESKDEVLGKINLKEKLLIELSDETAIKAWLLDSLGLLYANVSSYEKSTKCCEDALNITRNIDDKHMECICLSHLGSICSRFGDRNKGILHFMKSLKIATTIDDKKMKIVLFTNLGCVYSELGEVKKGMQYYEESLSLTLEIDDKFSQCNSLVNIGNSYIQQGKIKNGIMYYEKSLNFARGIGDKLSEINSLIGLGHVYRTLGQLDKCITYYNESLSITLEIDDKRNKAICLESLATVYCTQGETNKGIEYFKNSLRILNKIGDKTTESYCLNDLGDTLINNKKYQDAMACYLYAYSIRDSLNDPQLKITESRLKNLKEHIGATKFEKLNAEIGQCAMDLVMKFIN